LELVQTAIHGSSTRSASLPRQCAVHGGFCRRARVLQLLEDLGDDAGTHGTTTFADREA